MKMLFLLRLFVPAIAAGFGAATFVGASRSAETMELMSAASNGAFFFGLIAIAAIARWERQISAHYLSRVSDRLETISGMTGFTPKEAAAIETARQILKDQDSDS
jgi:hypothetical protein